MSDEYVDILIAEKVRSIITFSPKAIALLYEKLPDVITKVNDSHEFWDAHFPNKKKSEAFVAVNGKYHGIKNSNKTLRDGVVFNVETSEFLFLNNGLLDDPLFRALPALIEVFDELGEEISFTAKFKKIKIPKIALESGVHIGINGISGEEIRENYKTWS